MWKAPKGSKTPLRQHLKKVYETTGKLPDQLKEHPETPDEDIAYLWDWYLQVRSPGEYITWTEIKSWAEISSTAISGWEAEVLRTLDRIYFKEMAHD